MYALNKVQSKANRKLLEDARAIVPFIEAEPFFLKHNFIYDMQITTGSKNYYEDKNIPQGIQIFLLFV